MKSIKSRPLCARLNGEDRLSSCQEALEREPLDYPSKELTGLSEAVGERIGKGDQLGEKFCRLIRLLKDQLK